MVKNSGVHLDCLWQKHEQKTQCQKISNVYQTDPRYIFSNVFPLSPGRTSSVFLRGKKNVQFCVQTFYENILPVFVADVRCFYQLSYCVLSQLHTIMLWKQEICSCKMFVHKTGHIFFKNNEDVLPGDTGKTLEKIYLGSVW